MDLWWGSEEDSGAGKVAWCVRGRVEWWRWIRSAEAGFTMRFEDGDDGFCFMNIDSEVECLWCV